MTTVSRTVQVFIRAPLRSTFDYVADLTKHPKWSDGDLIVEALTTSPITVGKRYSSRGQVAAQKNRPNQLQVTEYEVPHRFGFSAHDPDFGEVIHRFTFTEEDGGVRITRTMTLNLHPLIAFAFRVVVYPLLGGPANQKAFEKLKAKLER